MHFPGVVISRSHSHSPTRDERWAIIYFGCAYTSGGQQLHVGKSYPHLNLILVLTLTLTLTLLNPTNPNRNSITTKPTSSTNKPKNTIAVTPGFWGCIGGQRFCNGDAWIAKTCCT